VAKGQGVAGHHESSFGVIEYFLCVGLTLSKKKVQIRTSFFPEETVKTTGCFRDIETIEMTHPASLNAQTDEASTQPASFYSINH